jgi:hypothetical protein
MATNLSSVAVEWIPAAFFAAPALVTVAPKQASHRDLSAGTGMTDAATGLTRRPPGIPL